MGEEKKKLQTTKSMEWQCWSCRMCLPLAGYDDSKPNTVNSDQQKLCITQGFWRTCLACKANPSESHTSRSVEAESRQRRTCQGFCGLSRDQSYFTEGAAKCNSCRLWESLQWGMCTECNSIKKYSLMGRIDFTKQTGLCYRCAPQLQLVTCTVCRRERPAADFQGTVTTLRQQYHRRCNDCRRCTACGIFYENARSMVSDAPLCTRCNTKHHCKICDRKLSLRDFPESQLHNKGDPL